MNGGLTYKDLEAMKRKAATLDEVREFLRGRACCDDEGLLAVREIVEAAYGEAPADPACTYPGCLRSRNTHVGTDHPFQPESG